jgi:hypothetical protein
VRLQIPVPQIKNQKSKIKNPMTSPELPTPVTMSRRNGKVARLPKATRDQINTMIQDGATYLQIIERIGPEGAGLTETNLSNWRNGGYIDWLHEQALAERVHPRHELAESIVARASEGNNAGHAVLQVLTSSLCEFLADTDPAALRESLLGDADKFTRFMNAVVRLTEGGIKCDLHRTHLKDRALALEKANRPKEQLGISPETLRRVEEALNLL